MGMVTSIQRFSLNDGPGIRTTVFFKGCNAACVWCHNPETLAMQAEVLAYAEQCIGCGACVGFSAERTAQGLPPPREALTPQMAQACCAGALVLAGREVSVEDVLMEIDQDAVYYETSGGGVTFSGGEAMMQPAFLLALLQACRAKGYHTALETNLAYDFALLAPLLPLVDLVMADVKLMDEARHRELVGLGNQQILENVARLAKTGLPYILRTPVVPGIQDDAREIAAIAAFVAAHADHLLYYELLNYNPLGAGKYASLHRHYALRDARPLSDEAMGALKAVAEGAGIAVRIG